MRLPDDGSGVRSVDSMEDFDEAVAAPEENGRGNKMVLIGLLVGLAGVIIGVTGIVLANQAQNQVRAL